MKHILIFIQILLLMLGYSVFLNQWIAPNSFPYLNLIPLGFPIIFILNVIMLIFWWLTKWRFGLLFTLLSAGLISPLNRTLHIYGNPETNKSNLKVMTYNVHYFKEETSDLIAMINNVQPDVIFWQETDSKFESVIQQLDYLQAPQYKRFRSQITISKYPIIEFRNYIINPHHTLLSYVDVALPKDTIRFVNFYMESLYIDQKQVKNAKVNRHLENLSKNLAKKAIRASQIHQIHIDSLLSKITDTEHPVIIGGDMNSVPNTYEYYALSEGRKDPFLSAGKGLGTTFPGFGYPIRLDYIFVPNNFKVKSHRILSVPYSDHYPVIIEVETPQ